MRAVSILISLSLLLAAAPGAPCVAAEAAALPTFQQARELESQGKAAEAFAAYLAVPGGEYAAVRLARPQAKEFLALLKATLWRSGIFGDPPRTMLVWADLLLATGEKEEALRLYRYVAESFARTPEEARRPDKLPADYYPVDPPQPEQAGWEALPFTLGPGSHRDNWLIRRFIALGAMDDAAREFERIWGLHREVAGDGQFSGLGLQFAIDYAYFLKRQDQTAKGLEVLLQPLLRVDMDRNPDLARPEARRFSLRFGTLAGVSRKEFIRIAYGAFKTAGREDALVEALSKQIEGGDNRARRVLARVRLHQGRVDDALALELAYIGAGDFDPLSAAYRRGLAFEDCQKLAEAAAEYEKALELPYAPPRLPDKDEERVESQMMSQAAMPQPGANAPVGRAQFQADILGRLHRLYGALGQTEKVLDVTLREFEANPSLLQDFRSLEQTARKFGTLGREAAFLDWAKAHLAGLESPEARANLAWLAGDAAAAAQALAGSLADRNAAPYRFEEWKERFRKAGKDKLRLLLQSIVAANPNDARARLELLDLDDRFEGDEVVKTLELLLDSDASYAFERGKGAYNRTRFRSYFDLAYRLMRLYDRRGELAKLRALGLRVASGEKPFSLRGQDEWSQFAYRDENQLPEDLNACLALVIQHADEATLAALEKAPLPPPSRAQLARRKGGWKPQATKAFGWANLPQGVSALACNENVLSLTVDAKGIYAGMPWGVAVYGLGGEPVTRVALGEAAQDLLAMGDQLYVATPIGLSRITIGSWEVARIALDRDVSARDREPDRKDFNNGAWALAADGPLVWIGTRRNIQRLDTRSDTLRVYSQEELGISSHMDWKRFLIDGDQVWASTGDLTLRYDRKADAWAPVVFEEKPVGLVALADGLLWGHVRLNNELRDRPCLIDRKSLAVKVILIEDSARREPYCINGPFAWLGTWQGKPVLSGDNWFFFDAAIGKLRPIPQSPDGDRPQLDSDLLPGLRGGYSWRKPNGAIECTNDQTHRHEPLAGFRFVSSRWLMARLPDGTAVLGGRRDRSPRFEYPNEDWPEAYETWDEEGGLYLVSPEKKVRRISSVAAGDALPGDVAHDVVFAKASPGWVCTNRGVAALGEAGGVLDWFTRADGLCANRVVGAAELDGRVYFATGWGDHGGGLAVFDPQTAVLTAVFRSDGLASDKLAGIEAVGGALKLAYDVEYQRHGNFGYRQCPPSRFDPKSGASTLGGEPRIMDQPAAYKIMYADRERRRSMPYLGGSVLAEREKDGVRYLCGTRGLVIVRRGGEMPPLAVRTLVPKAVFDPSVEQRAAAEAVQVNVASPDSLARYLEDENPYVRAKALAAVAFRKDVAEYAALIASQAGHPNLRVRCTALYALSKIDGEAVVPALRRCLDDPDRYVRAVAATELARRGHLPDIALLREILQRIDSLGNFPFGPSSTIGVLGNRESFYRAVAPLANRDLFALFLEYPLPGQDNYQAYREIFKTLGAALVKHPDAAPLLLKSYDRDPGSWGQVRFAQATFKYAGKPLLPTLHDALASPDRVVRSNAARACGAIGDPWSIPHVIKALDLESGLSRASIVWALGELKARDALPVLAKLYVDARNDEKRRAGSGFRAAQSQAAIQTQYETLGNLDAVGADWNELKDSVTPGPIDPARNEDLLRPSHVLEAVRKIGPAAAQDFYRSLAGEKDAEGRQEAAVGLAEGGKDDIEKNLVILRNLLADGEGTVRMAAAVSLLLLGQDMAQRPILEALASPNDWEKNLALRQLDRVKTAETLGFARKAIEAIAADQAVNDWTRQAAQNLLRALDKK